MTMRCINGSSCVYLRTNRCAFYHPENELYTYSKCRECEFISRVKKWKTFVYCDICLNAILKYTCQFCGNIFEHKRIIVTDVLCCPACENMKNELSNIYFDTYRELISYIIRNDQLCFFFVDKWFKITYKYNNVKYMPILCLFEPDDLGNKTGNLYEKYCNIFDWFYAFDDDIILKIDIICY